MVITHIDVDALVAAESQVASESLETNKPLPTPLRNTGYIPQHSEEQFWQETAVVAPSPVAAQRVIWMYTI